MSSLSFRSSTCSNKLFEQLSKCFPSSLTRVSSTLKIYTDLRRGWQSPAPPGGHQGGHLPAPGDSKQEDCGARDPYVHPSQQPPRCGLVPWAAGQGWKSVEDLQGLVDVKAQRLVFLGAVIIHTLEFGVPSSSQWERFLLQVQARYQVLVPQSSWSKENGFLGPKDPDWLRRARTAARGEASNKVLSSFKLKAEFQEMGLLISSI